MDPVNIRTQICASRSFQKSECPESPPSDQLSNVKTIHFYIFSATPLTSSPFYSKHTTDIWICFFFLIHHYLIFVSLFNTALYVSSCLYSLNGNLFFDTDGHSLYCEEYNLVQYLFWGVVQLDKEGRALA